MVNVWICVSCGNIFKPSYKDGKYNFRCPECNSNLTSPNLENKDKTKGISEDHG